MGVVLIHAGMPKTGSTSIQSWIRIHATELRETHGTTVVRDVAATPGRPLHFEVFPADVSVNAIAFLWGYHARLQRSAGVDELTPLVDEFVDALDRAASDLGTVLLSAEGFASVFAAGDEPFLRGLERLAQRHVVRVAYYVRPQHSALEARWRQWGFRTGMSPTAWVLDQAAHLRYLDTADAVARLAPSIAFEIRPFRPDLLDGGSVVVDFARQFLRIDGPSGAVDLHENTGLSLDFANLLRGAPRTLLEDPRDGIDTGRRQVVLAQLGRSWTVAESPEARESRVVLHRYAYREFEAGNGLLAERLQWPTRSFVPPPDACADADGDVGQLDELWEPRVSETARAYLYAALSDAVNAVTNR